MIPDYTPRYARSRLEEIFGFEGAEKIGQQRYQILK